MQLAIAAGAGNLERIYGVHLEHLAIARLREWVHDRRILRQGRIAVKLGTRGPRGDKDPSLYDARIVRSIDFQRAFETLSPEHQQLLWLRYGDGASLPVCAKAAGISERKATYAMPLAVQALARVLDDRDLL